MLYKILNQIKKQFSSCVLEFEIIITRWKLTLTITKPGIYNAFKQFFAKIVNYRDVMEYKIPKFKRNAIHYFWKYKDDLRDDLYMWKVNFIAYWSEWKNIKLLLWRIFGVIFYLIYGILLYFWIDLMILLFW